MQMFQKGRSMIEMLGVLAIIGVLSIGGLLGYRRAVNNHQANQILDDANRLAFVILESNQAFQTDDFMEEELIDSVTYTGTYNLDAFMAQAGQFGIVVTKVPKGVCEALLPKAVIEYKVRVMPWSEEKYLVPQMSNIGIVYDSFHKDICNDTNDVVLYFGDTSGQCNKPDEGEDYTKCLSNAECCGGAFCAFKNATYSESGIGRCELVSTYILNGGTRTMSDGRTWTRSGYGDVMNWFSAQNWCEAQGLSPVTRLDIGCDDILGPCSESDIFDSMRDAWIDFGGHWLADYDDDSGAAYLVYFTNGTISTNTRRKPACALCH